MRSQVLAVSLAGLLLALPWMAAADPAPRTPGPCAGCLVSLPAGSDPAPLLVLLHGDGETAGSILDAWEPAASRRGLVVLAPACPRAEGCTAQSWWKWNGDTAWLERQVSALGDQRAIDATRKWIVGWSGGGTYLGWRTQDFERDYAALVIHGGGVRPALTTCPSPASGIYFLGGDRNPFHDLAEQLHDFYAARCPHPDLTWTVLAGVDHAGERRALATYREGILDWLSTRRRTPPPTSTSTSTSTSTPTPTPTPTSVAPTPSCRCAAAGANPASRFPPVLLALLLVSALRRAGKPARFGA